MELPELLKILADRNRLRILALLGGRTACVCDLEAGLGINQSNLSRHLNRLRGAGLVEASKKGLFVYYNRTEPSDPATRPVLAGLYAAISLNPTFAADQERLAAFLKTKPAHLCD